MGLRAGLLAAVAVLAFPGVLHADPAPPATRTLARAEAAAALDRAVAALHPTGEGTRSAESDATLALRDLAARLPALAAADRQRASALLARPDDPAVRGERGYEVAAADPYCSPHVCVHYVTSTEDAPPLGDANADGVPDQVELTAEVLEKVWSTEVQSFGFRPPRSDLTSPRHGPDDRLDVYLADVGAASLYGFCPTDDPAISRGDGPARVASAFCVLDDDYAPAQFTTGASGREALEVTAAHEFFHAVQFAYDFFEDRWLMEGTATWIEDAVYEAVDDNHQYLRSSQLRNPRVPLDYGAADYGDRYSRFQYGTFVFFEHLVEATDSAATIERIWSLADATVPDRNRYSLQALEAALREQGSSTRTTFADFAAANAVPAASYSEGSEYPSPPTPSVVLGHSRPTAQGRVRLDHLTSAYSAFRPAPSLPEDARLVLELDLPGTPHATEARLVVVGRDGEARVVPVALDGSGNGQTSVPFRATTVRSVTLVLANSGTRLRCHRGTPYACAGVPLDDGLLFRYEAALVSAHA